jgi:hypothetical protein
VSDALRTPEDYELFLYTLTERFPSVSRSTVTFVRKGATLARVVGELYNAKHNRIPAPEMGFTRPNLPVLIQEVERLLRP